MAESNEQVRLLRDYLSFNKGDIAEIFGGPDSDGDYKITDVNDCDGWSYIFGDEEGETWEFVEEDEETPVVTEEYVEVEEPVVGGYFARRHNPEDKQGPITSIDETRFFFDEGRDHWWHSSGSGYKYEDFYYYVKGSSTLEYDSEKVVDPVTWETTFSGTFDTRGITLPWHKALDSQEGGDHYKHLAIQPIEYITKNEIGFPEGNVIKYVTRHKKKGGAEDIKKARHMLDIILEMYYEGS